AGVYQVPVIFVCQNNQWAISVPLSHQTRARTLAQKALAYGMPGIQVDGNDLLAVYAAAGEAVERVRSGQGPTLVECVTYRMGVHTTADDPKRDRSEQDVHRWQERDPLVRFEKYLLEKAVLSPEKIESIRTDIEKRIQTAVEAAEEQMRTMGAPLEMFDHLYDALPPYLEQQKEALKQALT
ncbi:MAG: thiamine pyrophosphate-dependent enzyme, partial [Desulfosarcinaceae bacterium]